MSSWKKKLFDAERPSKLRLGVMLFIYSTMILAVHGWWADFVPSTNWSGLGFYAAIISTIIFIVIYCISFTLGFTKLKENISLSYKLLSLIIIPALIFCFFWLSIVHGAGNIATKAFGHEGFLIMELSKSHHNNRRNCDYQLKGYAIENAMPSHICISEFEYSTLPESGEYTLEVKNSFFGFHINGFSVVSR